MDKKLFSELVESMKQMNEIVRGSERRHASLSLTPLRFRSFAQDLDLASRSLHWQASA